MAEYSGGGLLMLKTGGVLRSSRCHGGFFPSAGRGFSVRGFSDVFGLKGGSESEGLKEGR